MSDSPTPNDQRPVGRFFRLPRLSGKATAACLVAFFLATALLIPTVLRLPPWINFEIVLGIWWLTWWIVLAVLLYRSQRVSDDHALAEPRNWLSVFKSTPAAEEKKDPLDIRKKEESRSWWPYLYIGGIEAEGC